MSDLLTTPEAKEWIKSATERYAGGIFGQLKPAVIWSDARGPDGRLLVAADPAVLAGRINSIPHVVLHNHDPGKPKEGLHNMFSERRSFSRWAYRPQSLPAG